MRGNDATSLKPNSILTVMGPDEKKKNTVILLPQRQLTSHPAAPM